MRYRRFSALLALVLCALALVSQRASAEAAKAALVIGNGRYESGPPLAGCDQSARDVVTWLRQQGFEVEEAINASSVAMRSAIGNFVTLVSGAPQKTAIIYVCTYAAVANQRLFMLPIDSDPHQPTRLETQGVIVKALLNTLVGTNGVLFADLGLNPGKDAADAIDMLQSGLSPGVHVALVARDGDGIGALGRSLPGLLAGSGQDWGRLAVEFQAQHGPSHGDTLAVFAPPPGPMAPMQDSGGGSAPMPPAATVAAVPPPPSPTHPAVEAPGPAPAVGPRQPQEPRATPGATGAEASPPAPAPATPHAAASPGPRPAAHPDAAAQPPPRAPDQRAGRIQVALARRGFYSGQINGRMDSRTKDAVRAFQTTLGDRTSGVLTQIEIAKLLNPGP